MWSRDSCFASLGRITVHHHHVINSVGFCHLFVQCSTIKAIQPFVKVGKRPLAVKAFCLLQIN